jgi:hypothetical protein
MVQRNEGGLSKSRDFQTTRKSPDYTLFSKLHAFLQTARCFSQRPESVRSVQENPCQLMQHAQILLGSFTLLETGLSF